MASQRFPILFIAPSRIGDAILSSGLIRALAEEVEGARFTIVASALAAPLFAETPGLSRVIVMEKRPMAGHWFDLWKRSAASAGAWWSTSAVRLWRRCCDPAGAPFIGRAARWSTRSSRRPAC